uniref:Uncharacterized protein n=1 Tax=Rangifer tarandus platyrhynchus TaxID=3082113 RepID=A0ACB0EGG7_RANTA|nr:unnamed protein product [Rangifer tarandus platyrhynchus]
MGRGASLPHDFRFNQGEGAEMSGLKGSCTRRKGKRCRLMKDASDDGYDDDDPGLPAGETAKQRKAQKDLSNVFKQQGSAGLPSMPALCQGAHHPGQNEETGWWNRKVLPLNRVEGDVLRPDWSQEDLAPRPHPATCST